MIGIELPAGFLVGGAADLDPDPVCGMIIRPPDRAEDERIGIGWFQLLGRGAGMGCGRDLRAKSGQDEQKHHRKSKSTKTAGTMRRHRLRSPLPLPLPHSLLRLPSTPAGWW